MFMRSVVLSLKRVQYSCCIERRAMKQKAQHPNRLRALLREAGLTMREVHREATIPESTLYYWAAGHGVIPKEDRMTLACVIGCFPHDLAPKYDMRTLLRDGGEKC